MKRLKRYKAAVILWPLARILFFGWLGYHMAKFIRFMQTVEVVEITVDRTLLGIIAVGIVCLLACGIILVVLQARVKKAEREWDQLMKLVKDAGERNRIDVITMEPFDPCRHLRAGSDLDTDPPATRP